MKSHRSSLSLSVLLMLFVFAAHLHAQGAPTATRRLQLSTFATGTVVNTGIDGNRNYGLTAGIDLGIHKYFGVNPSFEVRGTYPFGGGVVRARNLLGGLRVSRPFGRVMLYADILFGRGQINYGASGVPNYLGTTEYVQTPSNVLSPGFGVDLGLSDKFSIKADFQSERYSTPVLASGRVYADFFSMGVAYGFGFGTHPK